MQSIFFLCFQMLEWSCHILEVDVRDAELGSGLKFLLGSPQLVPDVHMRVRSSVWVGQFLRNAFWALDVGIIHL